MSYDFFTGRQNRSLFKPKQDKQPDATGRVNPAKLDADKKAALVNAFLSYRNTAAAPKAPAAQDEDVRIQNELKRTEGLIGSNALFDTYDYK